MKKGLKCIPKIAFFIFSFFTIGMIFLTPLFKLNFIYKLFSFLCHQRAERSFFVCGNQFPVCARCFGIYFGVFIFSIYVFFKKINLKKFYFYLLLFIPMFAELFLEKFYEGNNILRFLTGVLGGIGFGFLIFIPFYYLIHSI